MKIIKVVKIAIYITEVMVKIMMIIIISIIMFIINIPIMALVIVIIFPSSHHCHKFFDSWLVYWHWQWFALPCFLATASPPLSRRLTFGSYGCGYWRCCWY